MSSSRQGSASQRASGSRAGSASQARPGSRASSAQYDDAKIEKVAKSFHTSMKGIGTDEGRIVREVKRHNNKQRQLIKKKYQVLFGTKLEEDLKSELSGDLLSAVLGLLTPLDEYEAQLLRGCMKGAGTDSKKVSSLLCSKDAEEVDILKAAYHRLYDRNLDEDINDDVSGHAGKVFRSVASGGRAGNSGFDSQRPKDEAEQFYDATQGQSGTEESVVVRILCSRSFNELSCMFEHYKDFSENDIEDALKEDLNGEFRFACQTIVRCARNRVGYFTDLIHESMRGAGCNEQDLLELIIRRCDVDLYLIKEEYQRRYGISLHDAVAGEIKGDFAKLLLHIIDNSN